MTVRLADTNDAPAIIALIRAYYAARGTRTQYREVGTWYVAGVAGHVYAAQNWLDVAPFERQILDTYAESNVRGRLALAALSRYTNRRADEEGMNLVGVTELDNHANQKAMEKRGWIARGVMYKREQQAVEGVA